MTEGAVLTQSYFLSYSRADDRFALRFATDLRSRGVALWLDQLDIRPSEHWDRAIERAVRDCCGLIVILSPRSVASDNVADEISYAIDSGKPVLPVMIERCTLPLRITRMHMIDATGDYGKALQQCLDAIGRGDCSARRTSEAPPAPHGIADAELIGKTKQHLMGILGPIAGILVDKTAAQADSTSEFYDLLAEHIESETDREHFMALAGRSTAPVAATRAPAAARPVTAGTAVSKADVDRLTSILIQYVGPIASVVAKRASAAAVSPDDFLHRLSSSIPSQGERAEFLRRARAG